MILKVKKNYRRTSGNINSNELDLTFKIYDEGLMANAQTILSLKQDNFDSTISQGVTLVDFYADWCGPCRMLTPVLEEIAKEMSDKLKVGKLDIDQNQKIAGMFQVTSIPTMILFKNGKEVNRLVGLRDLEGLRQFVSTVI